MNPLVLIEILEQDRNRGAQSLADPDDSRNNQSPRLTNIRFTALMGDEFMRRLKALLSGVVIGLLLGLWFGFNIGKGRTVYANPFTDPQVSGQIEQTREQAVEESGETLKEAGEELDDKAPENGE